MMQVLILLLHLKIHKIKHNDMKPSAPSKVLWIIALIIGILGFIFHFVASLAAYAFWFVLAAFVLLAIGTSFKKV